MTLYTIFYFHHIMTLTYFNDVSVYFHMRNHYKMLKQVKSVIDTSIPQSLLKSPLAMHSLQKRLKGTANEELRKIYNSAIYMPKRGGQVRRHNCLNSEVKSESTLRADSLPARPITRRSSVVITKDSFPPRSCSVGPQTKSEKMFKFRQKKRSTVSSTRSSTAENQNINLQLNFEKENSEDPSVGRSESPLSSTKRSSGSKRTPSIPETPTKNPDNKFLKESSEEHEYLLFLLRITEDIIVNDFYSNNDIRQVFRFHVEANKHRLNVKKMQFHIGNLCKELSIDCKEYQQEAAKKSEGDCPLVFKNSSAPGSHYLNNDAFINCHACATIRTSSLYKISFDGDSQLGAGMDLLKMDNGDNQSSISPSLLRLLEKLSLGRVTECTEPNASTSTVNSPKILMTYEKDEKKCDNKEKHSVDFDKFFKEMNDKEDPLVLQDINDTDNTNLTKEIIALESPPAEIHNALIMDKPQEHTELVETRSSKSLPSNSFNGPKLSSQENSNCEIELSVKDSTYSVKYEFDFEKSTSSNSTLKSEKSDEEKPIHDEKTHGKEENASLSNTTVVLDDTSNTKLKEIVHKNDDDIVNTVEDTQNSAKDFLNRPSSNEALLGEKSGPSEKDTTSLNAKISPLKMNEQDATTLQLNTNRNSGKTDDKDANLSETWLRDHQSAKITSLLNVIDQLKQNVAKNENNSQFIRTGAVKSVELVEDNQPNINLFLEALQTTNRASPNEQEHDEIDSKKNQDTLLKVILQGSLNDSDYVMINGPVYIYKPLLDSDPKLVVFKNQYNPKSRPNSADSQHSHRTFTVDHSHVREQSDADQQVDQLLLNGSVDEAVQFDQSLHSIEDDSMEDILELTRKTYSQFNDLKLLQSDYDLTPQKDSDDQKYHHLLADATTSVSGVNIKESLLLSDDYLVKTEENHQDIKQQVHNIPEDQKDVKVIDNYEKFKAKLFDNTYVQNRNRKVLSSVSMPKLQPKSDSSYKTIPMTDGLERNKLKSGEMLLGYNSDFINFDMPSLESTSSLRSEGETYPNTEKMNGEMPWIKYVN